MAARSDPKPVTALEPVLLFLAAAAFAAILALGLITGWVWIPGSRYGGGPGYWLSRNDNMGSYVVYIVIIGATTLGVLAMALDRRQKFNRQRARRR